MRISTELMNHWKFDALCTSTSFALVMSKLLVPATTVTDSPAGTGPVLNR